MIGIFVMKELIRANGVSRFIFSEKICFPFFYYKTEEFLFDLLLHHLRSNSYLANIKIRKQCGNIIENMLERFFAALLNVLFIT